MLDDLEGLSDYDRRRELEKRAEINTRKMAQGVYDPERVAAEISLTSKKVELERLRVAHANGVGRWSRLAKKLMPSFGRGLLIHVVWAVTVVAVTYIVVYGGVIGNQNKQVKIAQLNNKPIPK